MATGSWLQPHLEAVVRTGCPVLSSWRTQVPNLQGRIKNFENWILVELNHELLRTGVARKILTNGYFVDGAETIHVKRVRAADVNGLRGSKAKATYLSADLSVRATSGEYLIAEIKTGMAPAELLSDLRIVRFYREAGIAARAELGWVVIFPTAADVRRCCEKTFERICGQLREESDYTLKTTRITDWLFACVMCPATVGLPNQALHPTAANGR